MKKIKLFEEFEYPEKNDMMLLSKQNNNIHILPTDKPSKLHYSKVKSDDGLLSGKRNIYITSDEEIKVGDWFYNPFINDIQINCNHDGCKKIILTTDDQLIKDGVQPIDDEFLEWFVKNPSCEWVEVEEKKCTGQCWKFIESDYEETCLSGCEKIEYKIIIPKS
jgi:hypothetical protein